ncbi:glycosyltransferase family 4 protein [Pseudotamlana carrageenivorans]|uniref:Glycosyl transferase family 1 n=1 Tax=Pseudotamlana carrageenivorans TaxID=2069432 RepID=A0A2I7SIU9_9FLAO|nr:glycosyltransferase [Tamlana carrageenivorans]AUS05833.1 glycosyl transferase family 1 [Tamlana carrageenivorans]
MKNKKVVILFSRLSDYMLTMFNSYASRESVELFIFIKSPDEKEAPFVLNLNEKNITFLNQDHFDKIKLIDKVEEIDPNLIICSGWSNHKYNAVINKFYRKKPCILTMDNQWLGSLKQYFGLLYSRLFIKPKFNKIWVPGSTQKAFALKLGFKKENIITGWYVANEKKFTKQRTNINHEFVFVGRYVKIKGIEELWNAFIKLKETTSNNWKLTCIGTGELYEQKTEHPDINHLGFLQPNELQEYTKKGGVFVLPSHFEPWGVVVHEFALSSYPMIVSDKVGAASQFVTNQNGIIFESNNVNDLYNTMLKIVSLTNQELLEMSRASHSNGKTVSSENWINNMNSLLENAN